MSNDDIIGGEKTRDTDKNQAPGENPKPGELPNGQYESLALYKLRTWK